MELNECPHYGHYHAADQGCEECLYGAECQWLCTSDECSALAVKELEHLMASLEFAIHYLHTHPTGGGHNRKTCRCDTCSWLRQAKRLIWELERG